MYARIALDRGPSCLQRKCPRPAFPFFPRRRSLRISARCSIPSVPARAGQARAFAARSRCSCMRPAFGQLAQKLGGHCRFNTAVPARLSEFAILVTAKMWRAQYEWYAHVPQAERAGVAKATIRDIHRGRVPKSAPKDERAIYDFVQELYKTRRVSDRNFKRVHSILGDAAMVEFVGILGYYVLISMILNVFRMSPPADEPLPFSENR